MRTIKKLILVSLSGLVFLPEISIAQFEPLNGYAEEALLFSQTSWNGSARVQGIGSAQAALGGDISSISGNPAGLGFYNHSEFSFSPSLNFINTTSEYLGSQNNGSTTNFNIGNLGVVINRKKPAAEGAIFLGGSFGFSYNRINDFHHEVLYSGKNNNNDFIGFVLDEIRFNNNGKVNKDVYYQQLSWQTYLINDFDINQSTGDTIYNTVGTFVDPQGINSTTAPQQSESIKTNGSQDQWSISYGGNISDRFYFGMGLGIVSINYKSNRQYSEVRSPQTILDYFVLNESLRITGVGINGTFGAIVRPVDIWTIGIAYTTPTVYSISDEFNADMQSVWRNEAFSYYPNDSYFTGNQNEKIDPIVSDYQLKTPGRLNLGSALFIGKNGFITGDAEWVNYSKGNLSGGGIDFQNDNNDIQSWYKNSTWNYRIGGEYRIKAFRVRAGIGRMVSPYNDESINHAKTSYSGGAGYRGKSFYSDLAMMFSTYKSTTTPYTYTPQPIADITTNKASVILTMGFLF
jgi:hypothetical protein